MLTVRQQLLAELVAHDDSFVSGSMLADKMELSRVSIKKHVDQLVEQGFEIEAVRNRGYCLKQFPVSLQEDAFRFYLANSLLDESVHVFKTIDSTNLEMDRRLNAGDTAPSLAIAANQSQGKGRRGNQWASASGENLYLTLGFRPEIPLSRIGQYTLWLGMKLAELLRVHPGLEVSVKWPNDLYLGGKKLAGILTEAKIDTDHVQHLIVGLGLNINGQLGSFPDELKEKATSLRIARQSPCNFNEVAASVAKTVLEASVQYFDESRVSEIQEHWPQYDFLLGKKVQAKSHSGQVQGTAAGIDERGELKIRLEDGSLCTVNSGEVTMAFE